MMWFTFLACCVVVAVVVNYFVRRSTWYKQRYSDYSRFRVLVNEFDVVNLGSSSSQYGFDYIQENVKGENWGVAPQCFEYDFHIWKKYYKCVKKQGTVLLVISPFSSVKLNFDPGRFPDVFYFILPRKILPGYKWVKKISLEAKRVLPLYTLIRHPRMMKGFVKSVLMPQEVSTTGLTDSALAKDAHVWMTGWRNQFGLVEETVALSENNQDAFRQNVEILGEMIKSIKAYGCHPVLVVHPLSTPLKSLFTNNMLELYLYNFVRTVVDTHPVRILDYMRSPQFEDPCLFANALWLNPRGRKIFTNCILRELANGE